MAVIKFAISAILLAMADYIMGLGDVEANPIWKAGMYAAGWGIRFVTLYLVWVGAIEIAAAKLKKMKLLKK